MTNFDLTTLDGRLAAMDAGKDIEFRSKLPSSWERWKFAKREDLATIHEDAWEWRIWEP